MGTSENATTIVRTLFDLFFFLSDGNFPPIDFWCALICYVDKDHQKAIKKREMQNIYKQYSQPAGK